MNDILLTPIRLNELETLIMNSVRKALAESQPSQQLDRWYSIDGLCDYLPEKPAKQTVYTWVSNRIIPYHKGQKTLRFLKSEIDEWLLSGRKHTVSEIAASAFNNLGAKNKKG